MLHWIADRIDRMVAATLPTWAAWAQIASVLVSAMIAVAVYLASRRSTENTNKLLAETRGLIHANRRAELIREVSQANTAEHLRSLRDEITASFRDDETLLLRILYRNPAIHLPTMGTRITAELVDGIYRDLPERYDGWKLADVLRDVATFAETARPLDLQSRQLLGLFISDRLAAIDGFELVGLGHFLTAANLDTAEEILCGIGRVNPKMRARVILDTSRAIIDATEGRVQRFRPPRDHDDLVHVADGVANAEADLRSMPEWDTDYVIVFAPELVFTFVHACACTTPHLSEYMLHKYVLSLCKGLLRKVGPLDAGAIVPARALNQAIACFAATLSNPIQAVFESERARILRDVVEDRL